MKSPGVEWSGSAKPMFLYKINTALSMRSGSERRTFAQMEKMSVNKSGSTQDLLSYLDEDVPGYSNYRNLYVIGLFAMVVFALPSNIAVMVLLYKKMFWKSNVLLLLFQLSVADIFVAFFCILGDAIWNVTIQWNGGDGLCRFYKYMQMFSLYASTFILTGISIDRCIAVLFPLSHNGTQGQGPMPRVRVISVVAWLAALACAAPQAVIFHTETAPFQDDFKQCVTHGAYTEQWQELAYSLTTLIIMFFLPVLIMALCYIGIFTRITKEARQASGHIQAVSVSPEANRVPRQQLTKKRKPLKLKSETGEYVNRHSTVRKQLYSRVRRATLWMTVVFVLCFIVCWAPYYVGMFCYILQVNIGSEALNLIFCFGMSSAIINPFIYAAFNVCSRKNPQSAHGSSQPVQQQILCRRGPQYHLVRRPAYDLQRKHPPAMMKKPSDNAYLFAASTKQPLFSARNAIKTEECDYHW